MTNTIHQMAGDARFPLSMGGSGQGTIKVTVDLSLANLVVDSEHKLFKFAKKGFVGNFAIVSDVNMETAGPTLTLDVGDASNDDKFIAGATGAQVFAGYYTNALAETTIAGTEVAADSFIILSVKAAAATAVVGTVTVTFQYTALDA
jgi:hypothetical protein